MGENLNDALNLKGLWMRLKTDLAYSTLYAVRIDLRIRLRKSLPLRKRGHPANDVRRAQRRGATWETT